MIDLIHYFIFLYKIMLFIKTRYIFFISLFSLSPLLAIAKSYFYKTDKFIFLIQTQKEINAAIVFSEGLINFNDDVEIHVTAVNDEVNYYFSMTQALAELNLDDVIEYNSLSEVSFFHLIQETNSYGEISNTFKSGDSVNTNLSFSSLASLVPITHTLQTTECIYSACTEIPYQNSALLSQHVSKCHSKDHNTLDRLFGTALMSCPLCNYVIRTRQGLIRHLRWFHPTYKIYLQPE